MASSSSMWCRYSLAEKMFATSAEIEYEVSEFETAGLTSEESQRVKPPRVAESPVRFECEVMQIVHIGEGPLAANVVIGKILLIDILESVLDDRQKIDPALAGYRSVAWAAGVIAGQRIGLS